MSLAASLAPIVSRFRSPTPGYRALADRDAGGLEPMTLPHAYGTRPLPYPRGLDVHNLDGTRAGRQLFAPGPLSRVMAHVTYASLRAGQSSSARDVAGARSREKGNRIPAWLFGGATVPTGSARPITDATSAPCRGC